MVILDGRERILMENQPRRPQFASRPENSNANVTSAIGMEETVGRLRARRNSLFTHTVMWVTGLICLAFLFGTVVQAWSNSQLMQQLQAEQQKLQQIQIQHDRLIKAAHYYNDPTVIEREARQQLGYVRPGEQPVVVVGADNQQQPGTQTSPPRSPLPSYWQDWWNIFFR